MLQNLNYWNEVDHEKGRLQKVTIVILLDMFFLFKNVIRKNFTKLSIDSVPVALDNTFNDTVLIKRLLRK